MSAIVVTIELPCGRQQHHATAASAATSMLCRAVGGAFRRESTRSWSVVGVVATNTTGVVANYNNGQQSQDPSSGAGGNVTESGPVAGQKFTVLRDEIAPGTTALYGRPARLTDLQCRNFQRECLAPVIVIPEYLPDAESESGPAGGAPPPYDIRMTRLGLTPLQGKVNASTTASVAGHTSSYERPCCLDVSVVAIQHGQTGEDFLTGAFRPIPSGVAAVVAEFEESAAAAAAAASPPPAPVVPVTVVTEPTQTTFPSTRAGLPPRLMSLSDTSNSSPTSDAENASPTSSASKKASSVGRNLSQDDLATSKKSTDSTPTSTNARSLSTRVTPSIGGGSPSRRGRTQTVVSLKSPSAPPANEKRHWAPITTNAPEAPSDVSKRPKTPGNGSATSANASFGSTASRFPKDLSASSQAKAKTPKSRSPAPVLRRSGTQLEPLGSRRGTSSTPASPKGAASTSSRNVNSTAQSPTRRSTSSTLKAPGSKKSSSSDLKTPTAKKSVSGKSSTATQSPAMSHRESRSVSPQSAALSRQSSVRARRTRRASVGAGSSTSATPSRVSNVSSRTPSTTATPKRGSGSSAVRGNNQSMTSSSNKLLAAKGSGRDRSTSRRRRSGSVSSAASSPPPPMAIPDVGDESRSRSPTPMGRRSRSPSVTKRPVRVSVSLRATPSAPSTTTKTVGPSEVILTATHVVEADADLVDVCRNIASAIVTAERANSTGEGTPHALAGGTWPVSCAGSHSKESDEQANKANDEDSGEQSEGSLESDAECDAPMRDSTGVFSAEPDDLDNPLADKLTQQTQEPIDLASVSDDAIAVTAQQPQPRAITPAPTTPQKKSEDGLSRSADAVPKSGGVVSSVAAAISRSKSVPYAMFEAGMSSGELRTLFYPSEEEAEKRNVRAARAAARAVERDRRMFATLDARYCTVADDEVTEEQNQQGTGDKKKSVSSGSIVKASDKKRRSSQPQPVGVSKSDIRTFQRTCMPDTAALMRTAKTQLLTQMASAVVRPTNDDVVDPFAASLQVKGPAPAATGSVSPTTTTLQLPPLQRPSQSTTHSVDTNAAMLGRSGGSDLHDLAGSRSSRLETSTVAHDNAASLGVDVKAPAESPKSTSPATPTSPAVRRLLEAQQYSKSVSPRSNGPLSLPTSATGAGAGAGHVVLLGGALVDPSIKVTYTVDVTAITDLLSGEELMWTALVRA